MWPHLLVTHSSSLSNGQCRKTRGIGLVKSVTVCPSGAQLACVRLSSTSPNPPQMMFCQLPGSTSLVLHHHRPPVATVDLRLDPLDALHPLELPLPRHRHPCQAAPLLHRQLPLLRALRFRFAVSSPHMQSAKSLANLLCLLATLCSFSSDPSATVTAPRVLLLHHHPRLLRKTSILSALLSRPRTLTSLPLSQRQRLSSCLSRIRSSLIRHQLSCLNCLHPFLVLNLQPPSLLRLLTTQRVRQLPPQLRPRSSMSLSRA